VWVCVKVLVVPMFAKEVCQRLHLRASRGMLDLILESRRLGGFLLENLRTVDLTQPSPI
jgi:hypothetical protein